MKRILVAAAVIRCEGKILVARRPADKHQGGLWEFPGGKVEAGEPVAAALVRELEEELGIVATAFRPLIRITHDYPDKSVCLDVWEVSSFTGEAHGREGQPVRWVRPDELRPEDFPAANRPIITAARLPSRYLITPDELEAPALDAWLTERLARGISLVLFRAPGLSPADYLARAGHVLRLCREQGAQLLLHGADPAWLREVPADGLHLPAAWLPGFGRRTLPEDCWLAASTHNREELLQAAKAGVDFVTLSPVRPTPSHPGRPGMGWEAFAALVREAGYPVYALGGMRPEDRETAWGHGAQGIAGIRGL